jgi:hypothetical protein
LLSTLALLYKGSGRMSQSLRRNRIQFLLLHHVFEDEVIDFRRLIQFLERDHCFVSYSEAVTMVANSNIDRPCIALSFDDGFQNCMQAAQIMEEYNIKACFFVNPPVVGETDYNKISKYCDQRLKISPMEFMSWNDIDRLLKAGHEIGGHTLTHPNMSRISSSEIVDEVEGSFEALKARIGDVKHFAWPLGRFFHFSPFAANIVFKTGFQTCASGERGCHIPSEISSLKELCIRRDHVLVKWPINHIQYFLAKNSHIASAKGGRWPIEWEEDILGNEGLK